MAKDRNPPKKNEAGQADAGSGKGFVIALALLTLIAGGGGYVFSSHFLGVASVPSADNAKEPPTENHGESASHGKEDTAKPTASGELVQLPTIFTNLAEPADSYLRLEGYIVVEPGFSDGKILAAKVSEDVIALLKATTLSELQGALGLYHFREDVNDRVKIRSEGKATELIINTLVIE